MSELQFPKDPIVGQQYDFPPYKYYWDGSKWKTIGIGYNPVNDLRDEVLPTTREALRRSYAEAGLNLVDGSFEEGGILTSASDVLLHKASGIAYSGPIGSVAAGTDPAAIGSRYTPRTNVVLRNELAGAGGAGLVGGIAKPVTWDGFAGGADPTGVADSTASFQAAANSGEQVIIVPPGHYKITSKIVITTPVCFLGSTPESSRLYFYDCDGFDYQLPSTEDNSSEIILEHLAFATTAKGTRKGVSISMISGTGATVAVQIKDCAFIGADVFDDIPSHIWSGESAGYALEWLVSVDGNDCDNLIFRDNFIRGNSKATEIGFPTQVTGLRINNTTYVTVQNNRIYFMNKALSLNGQSEGIRFINNDVVACYYGFINDSTSSPANHYTITGNHFSTRKGAIKLLPNSSGGTLRTGQHFIHSNFILKRNESNEPLYPLGEANYIGIDAACNYSHIFHNVIQNNVANTDVVSNGDIAIKVDGEGNNVVNNNGYNCGAMVFVASGPDNKVVGNSLIATGTSTGSNINDMGTNTVKYGNTSAEDGTRGTFPIQSNVRIGNNLVASTKFLDVLTSGMNDIYDTRFEFLGGGASTGSGEVRVRAGTFYSLAANALFASVVKPNTDNTFALGLSTARWSTVYAGTGTINTSDAREKTAPLAIDDAVLDAWGDVQLITFQWLNSIQQKGEDIARWHFGVIAQQVRNAFVDHGIDGTRYGLLCYDEWGASDAVVDANGNMVTDSVAAGDRWGIRPDQCLFLEAAYQRRRCERIEARLAAAGL